MRVREVTKQIGISARHFGQLFRERVGLTPKLFCRVQRWRRVLYLLAGKEYKAPSTEELFKNMRGKVKYFEDLTTPTTEEWQEL